MALLSAIGGGWGSLAVLPLVASTRTRRVGGALAVVLAITAVFVFALKRIVARVRPCFCLDGIQVAPSGAPTDFSFPSGHAAGSFAFAIFVAVVLVKTTSREAALTERWARRLGAAVLTCLAIGVALSRIALGVHFPGDVAAGALLGATIAALGAYVHFAAPDGGMT
jgi:undecaprenyl-diphosphatase